MRLILIAGLTLLAAAATADDRPKFKELPPPPPRAENYRPPAPPADETIPEPEVVITTKGEDRHEEYRVGGKLYMVKVTPRVGKPYYLVDREGRGDFQRSDLEPSVNPPMWVIKKF